VRDVEILVHTDVAGGTAHATLAGRSAGHLGFRVAVDREGMQVWTLFTTVVDPAFEGRGVGSRLVADVIAHAETAGALVDPTCWFVAGWLDRHREYQHMLADDLR
jgi:hypothetical protein